jgi:hypothetical protein
VRKKDIFGGSSIGAAANRNSRAPPPRRTPAAEIGFQPPAPQISALLRTRRKRRSTAQSSMRQVLLDRAGFSPGVIDGLQRHLFRS